MSTNNPVVNEWIYFAQMDYDHAFKSARTFHPVPIEIICYHCQQSVEKILKGYIVAQEGTVAKTHDLESLIEQCKKYSSDFDMYAKSCFTLTTYISSTRYPPKLELTEQHMELALKDASNILEFTKSKLKELGYEYNSRST
jgi:HEPN domain-containing protein